MVIRFAVGILLVGAVVTAAITWSPVGAAVLGAVGGAAAATGNALWKRSQDRLVDRLDRRVGTWLSTFDRRYRRHVLASLRFVDLKGLATVGFANPELDEVYVDVGVAPKAPHLVGGGVVGAAADDRRHHVGDLLDRSEPTILAVIGPPGSGKTTLLRHTARAACRTRRRRSVPILLTLRDRVDEIVAGKQLPAIVHGLLVQHVGEVPRGWAEQHLRAGRCLILLDGLDEIARAADRRRVSEWVEEQTRLYPRNDYVISSRPQGYREAPVAGATVVRALPFTDAQVRAFVLGWYRAVERHSTGDTDVQDRATAAADDLLTRLAAAPGLAELTVNPLLLTMIANVHRFRGALPGSRAELYREMCQVALWRRQDAKNLTHPLAGERRESLLRALAFTMMALGVRELPRMEVLAKFADGLRRFATSSTAEDVLADACSNGLLVEREQERYAFAHLTFQEYLAAAHIRDTDRGAWLASKVDDPWWRETTVLYCASAPADEIVAACLENGRAEAMILALDCAEPGSDLAPELRERVARWLDVDAHERPEVMAVLLARHLRGAVAVNPGVSLCAEPLPPELLRMAGAADELTYPVAAQAVARLAPLLPQPDRTLRLPHHAELERLALTDRAAWCGYGQLWTPEGHDNVVTAAMLRELVDQDLAVERSHLTTSVALAITVELNSFGDWDVDSHKHAAGLVAELAELLINDPVPSDWSAPPLVHHLQVRKLGAELHQRLTLSSGVDIAARLPDGTVRVGTALRAWASGGPDAFWSTVGLDPHWSTDYSGILVQDIWRRLELGQNQFHRWSWLLHASGVLTGKVDRYLVRGHRDTATTRAIRLLSVALAAECSAAPDGWPQISAARDSLFQLAAAVSVPELRARGQLPPVRLVLAVDSTPPRQTA